MISEAWRDVLVCRSVRDKLGISFFSPPTRSREAVAEMIAAGYLVWLDRAVVSELREMCDVYLLTPKGVKLCEREGIPQR